MNYEKSINKVFNRITKNKKILETVLLVENTEGDFSYSKEYGDKDIDSFIVMASITKLFTTTCILILKEHGQLSFQDKIDKYIDVKILEGIHVYKKKDYSFELTIYDLLYQTSGLPDVYLETSNSIKKHVIEEDRYISFDEMIGISKGLTPHFPPNRGNKAYYADINFDLLGKIIEKVTDLPIEEAYKKYIFHPLGLCKTYLPTSENEYIPKIYYKEELLYRPKTIICSGASGGCISTTRELMIFIKAFFKGKLFNTNLLKEESIYRKMQGSMGPICYGCGHMRISLGGIETFFQGEGELVGHFGSTGSFAFYYPLKDLFFVGDINQMANPSIPLKLVIQLGILTH